MPLDVSQSGQARNSCASASSAVEEECHENCPGARSQPLRPGWFRAADVSRRPAFGRPRRRLLLSVGARNRRRRNRAGLCGGQTILRPSGGREAGDRDGELAAFPRLHARRRRAHARTGRLARAARHRRRARADPAIAGRSGVDAAAGSQPMAREAAGASRSADCRGSRRRPTSRSGFSRHSRCRSTSARMRSIRSIGANRTIA